MSYRAQWKMIHALNTCDSGKLNLNELNEMGIRCYEDTIQELIKHGLVKVVYQDNTEIYSLNSSASSVLNDFIVCNGNQSRNIIYVDQPTCFVIMPFSQPFEKVFKEFIQPAIESTGMALDRGDGILRLGSLNNNILKKIQEAGLIIADISSQNVNVFYELGMTDLLGKDRFLLIQDTEKDKIPADQRGEHYYTYNLNNLLAAKNDLKKEIDKWMIKNNVLNTTKYCKIT